MDPIIPSKPNPVANKFAHALELATGHWPLPIGRTSFRHSRPATLCRGFREGDSVHRLQASLHSRGRPSAPCKADLYYRGALKRHSEAHPMAFMGYVWMPSCQMPSCQIESMGEFIGHCHILRINTWILSPPPKTNQSPINPPMLSNWQLGIWRLPIRRIPLSHSRQATLWRGFRRPPRTRPHKRGHPQRCPRGELVFKESPQAALGRGLRGSLSSEFAQRGPPQRPRPRELVSKGSPEAAL